MQSLAILGGTFNPVHWGHLWIAETALRQFTLDRVIWVPTYNPPYKSATKLLGFQHRVQMVQRAIANYPQFVLSTVEAQQPTSYAVQTLQALQTHYSSGHWSWIIGLDALQTLPRWYHHQELIKQCKWLVAPRSSSQACDLSGWDQPPDGFERNALVNFPPLAQPQLTASLEMNPEFQQSIQICEQVEQQLAREAMQLDWHLLLLPPVNISSSLIRQRCRDRHSIRYLVPDAVQTYILEHHLYQEEFYQEELYQEE
ncbi:MAG: hypothetical protein Kow00121_01910 [Elainellaceae cyanobacterium]